MAAREKKYRQERRYKTGESGAPQRSGSSFSRDAQDEKGIPTLEWIAGGIGCVILVGVLGFLLYAGISEDRPLPDVQLAVDQVSQLPSGYLVRVSAINQGGMTAEGVIVEGELWSGSELVERSWTMIEFLPSRSKKRAGLFFSKDPTQFELKLRPHGYEEP